MPRRKEFLLLGFTLTLLLLLAEGGLRAMQRLRYGTPLLSSLPGHRETTFRRSPFLVFGPRVDYVMEHTGPEAWARFNAAGLRLPAPLPERVDGEFRIVALGGSTTEGVGNPLGIHWPLGFECLARARGRDDIRVVNAAMSAYTTAHSLVRYAFDVSETQPDLVIVMHNINDLMVTYDAASQGRVVDPNYLVRYGRKRFTNQVDESDVAFSRLLHLIRGRLRSRPPLVPWQDWQYDLAVGEQYFRRNLGTLVDAIRGSGAIPVLLTMPRSSEPAFVARARHVQGEVGLTLFPAMDRFLSDFDRFNEVIREVGVSKKVMVLDVARAFPDDTTMFVDMVHHSTAGVRRLSRIVDSLASPSLLPPPSGKRLAGLLTCEGVL